MFKYIVAIAALAITAVGSNTCDSISTHTSTLHTTLTIHETLTTTATETVTLTHASAIVTGSAASASLDYNQPALSEASTAVIYLVQVSAAAVPYTSEAILWTTVPKTVYVTEYLSAKATAAAVSPPVVTTHYITETSTIYSTIIATLSSSSSSSSITATATAAPFTSLHYGGWKSSTTEARDDSSTISTSSLTNNTRLSTLTLPSASSIYGNTTQHASSEAQPVTSIITLASRTVKLSSSTTTTFGSSSTSLPVPTTCGESGNFTLGWDDEPIFDPSPTDPIMFPPVFNPYHHLFFSNGYAYAPPPSAPFKPITPPHMAVFLPNASSQDIGSPSAAGARPGELGAGPRAYMSAYWFNINSAYIGCDNDGPEGCLVEFVGFEYDAAGNTQTAEKVAATHSQTLSGCPGYKNCTLAFIHLPATFTALSGLQISATVSNAPVLFWLDNLSMGWYNNTCAAGLLRQMSRK